MNNRIKSALTFFIFGGLLLFFAIFILLLSGQLSFFKTYNIEKAGSLGDFIAGFVGTLWSGAGIFLIYETLVAQNKQFDEIRKTESLNRFDSNFYYLLNNLQSCINMMKYESERKNIKYEGRAYLRFAFKELSDNFFFGKTRHYNRLRFLLSERHNPFFIADGFDLLAETIKVLDLVYKEFFEKHGQYIGHYFRLVHNTIEYIIKNNTDDEEKIKYYVGLLQANMSDEELALIFYNCLSEISENSYGERQFYNNVNKFALLENINPQKVFIFYFYELYPDTKFKYVLNYTRLKNKLINKYKK